MITSSDYNYLREKALKDRTFESCENLASWLDSNDPDSKDWNGYTDCYNLDDGITLEPIELCNDDGRTYETVAYKLDGDLIRKRSCYPIKLRWVLSIDMWTPESGLETDGSIVDSGSQIFKSRDEVADAVNLPLWFKGSDCYEDLTDEEKEQGVDYKISYDLYNGTYDGFHVAHTDIWLSDLQDSNSDRQSENTIIADNEFENID